MKKNLTHRNIDLLFMKKEGKKETRFFTHSPDSYRGCIKNK